MRLFNFIFFVIFVYSSNLRADIVQSATIGTPLTSGTGIGSSNFPSWGWVFEVASPVTVDRIGGTMYQAAGLGTELFGFIYDVTGLPSNFPDISINNPSFTSSPRLKVLANFTGLPPVNPGYADFLTPITPTFLNPGTYVLMFGGGNGASDPLLGADARGVMVGPNPQIGVNQYIFWSLNSGGYINLSSFQFRFAYSATPVPVPEPSTYLIAGTMLGLLLFLNRRRNYKMI